MVTKNKIGSNLQFAENNKTSFYWGAYALNEMISLGLEIRGMSSMNSFKRKLNLNAAGTPTTLELDSEQTGKGVGGIIGFNVAIGEINIGLRYETETAIELKYDRSKDDFGMFPDDEKEKHNIPAILGQGIRIRGQHI